ncbi:hypothetical protein LTR37_020217 [Vermiconidia calcicola]|uniref:Uncharacterized protein n=1 Tax=Vermiconidia calcicola TaxID=1690605 RepID=A0ACC3MD78_9PEZI|nr:hypothetical protein LTR37_020217 [Vermiconidia calcicola]
MAPLTFNLIALNDSTTPEALLSSIAKLGSSERPVYVGKCQHWIHAPHLSADGLSGTGPTMLRWDYLVVIKASSQDTLALPNALKSLTERVWSITTNHDDSQLENYAEGKATRQNAAVPPLPNGWSPNDHSGLDAAVPPPDLEASLGLIAYPLGSRKDEGQKPTVLKDFVRDFGTQYNSPVDMFNLLSFVPGQQPRYYQYIAAFTESVGSKYGGDAIFLGTSVGNWSSKADEQSGVEGDAVGWEHSALIHYPSIWHFGKMLDDPGYADADRRFKQGALRDNPIMCCTEVEVSYE